MFLRPCFLVVDREFAGSISSRKLVLETAKFNVITAYSFPEAVATLDRYPALQGIVVTSDTDGECERFLRWVRAEHENVKVVVTGAASIADGLANRQIEGFAPEKLLETLRDLFPADAQTAEDVERKLEADASER